MPLLRIFTTLPFLCISPIVEREGKTALEGFSFDSDLIEFRQGTDREEFAETRISGQETIVTLNGASCVVLYAFDDIESELRT